MNRKGLLWAFGLGIFLFGLRDFTGWIVLGRAFTPFSAGSTISASVWDESGSYAPAVSALATRGQLFADDLKENRAISLPLPSLHAILLAPFAKLFGLETAWCLARILFAALSMGLFYLIFSTVIENHTLRLLASVLATTFPFAPRNMLLRGQFALVQPLELTRFSNPGLSFCLLLAILWVAKKFIESGDRRRGVTGGLFLGLMSYCYYYYSLSLAFGLGALWITMAVRKEWIWFRRLSEIIAVSAIVALPYTFVLIQAQAHIAETLIPRVGTMTHQADGTGLGLFLVTLALGVWQFTRTRKLTYDLFFLFLLAGAGLGLNLQTLTGYEPQHEHYWNRLIQPIGFAYLLMKVAAVANAVALPLPRIATRALAGLALLFCTGVGAFRQVSSMRLTVDDHDRRAAYYQTLEWVRDHTPTDTVVGSTERQVIALLPTVAGRWSFVPFGLRTSASLPEILGRYYSLAKLEGKTWDEIEEAWKFKQFDRLWIEPYFILFHNSTPPFPAFLNGAQTVWETFDAERFIIARQLNYVITQRAVPGNPVFENNGWKVIEIKYVANNDVAKKRASP